MFRRQLTCFLWIIFGVLGSAYSQGNKLTFSGSGPKNLSICGNDDTASFTVYNISASVVSSIKVTLTLPTGINYVAGSVAGTGMAESNISNLNKPVFTAPTLLLAQNFTFRVKLTANCDLLALLNGSYTPDIGIRADYTGNYDVGTSSPFVPNIPSPGYASITNLSFTGNVGDKFVRTISITNYGKGPLNGIRLMLINGSDLKGTPQKGFSNTVNGDTVWTNFKAADIKKIGDKDSLFEQNETITITDTFVINACNKVTTYFEIGWGCGGKICQVIKNNGSVTISSDNPNLKTWPTSVSKLCFDGTTPNNQGIVITNIGKKDAKDVTFVIYTPYGASNCRIDTATIWVKKGYKGVAKRVRADSCRQPYYVASCMPVFSITYMQLKLGVLAPGDTLYLNWDMYRCSSPDCGFAFYDLGWVYNYNFKNQCNSLSAVGDQWGRVYSAAWGTVSLWVPTDLAKDETKDFKFTFTSFYNVPLDKTGQIRVDFVVPKTLTHSLNKSDFFITNNTLTSTWYPDSIAWRKDTLRAFYGNNFPFNLTNGELTVRLKGICTQYSGNASLPVSMSLYYNPMPSCNPYIWIRPVCVSFSVKVHCSSSCNGGMQFKNFEIYRSSYGLPDNDNDGLPDKTGTLDMTKIRQERAMYGDTVTTVYVGRPKATSSINNWRYGYAESFVTYGYYMDVVDAKLLVYKGGSLYSGNCNSVRVKKINSGGNATFKFDFTVDSIYPKGCLSSTYRYTVNDSIRLVVRYRVSGNISAQGVLANFSNRFYFGSVANPGTGQWYQCDTFSGNLMIYGFYRYNCCGDNVVYSNCAEVGLNQSWYLALGAWSYAGNNLFPYEYRNWTRIKSLKIYLPSGLKLVNTYFGQYRTSGTGAYTWEHKDTIQPVSTNPLVYDFAKYYKDSGGVINLSDDGVQGYFTYTVQPRCNLPANKPVRIDYDYVYERKGTWGKGYDTVSTKVVGSEDYFTFVPPTLKLTPAVPTVYATKDTADWIVSFSNPSATFSAYNVWLSPKSNSNIKVVEVRDYDKDTVIKPSADIYKAGVLATGQLRRFKIRATFNSCSPDSLTLYGSYDCADYPADFASYPCNPISTTLYIEPQNTRLQLTLTDSTSKTDLCATNKMTLLVENIQAVTAYNTKIRVSLPIGMQVVNNSAKMRYPLNSSSVAMGQPVLVSGTIYEWDLGAISSAIAKGFTGTTDTSKNKIFITFRVKTDCDYASGSFVSARAVANIKCGDPIPSIAAFSDPLDIKGVTRPYYTLVKSWADTLLPCEKPMTIKTRVIFLGPGKSGSKDKVEIFLPNGISRDTSYWNAVRNAPPKDSVTVTTINGASLLSWKIPASIVPGDSMEFHIKVNGFGPDLFCGPADILTRTVVVQPIVCVTTGSPCDIKVITGSELANPLIDKGSLDVINTKITSKLISSDSEEVALTYTIKNTGRYMNGSDPIVIRYHYDGNNNGKWDAADKRLGTDTIKQKLSVGGTISINRKLHVKAGQSCAILAVVDSAACSCKFGQRRFGVPPLVNAGNDTAICSAQPLKLGTVGVKNFSYFWDNYLVLDDRLLAQPSYISQNNGGTPDTSRLILATNRGLCTTKDTVNVIVFPLPAVYLNVHDTQFCEKTPVLMKGIIVGGNGGNNVQWSPSAGVVSPTSANTLIKANANQVYTMVVKDKKGCIGKDSVKIKVFPYPKPWFTWPITCAGKDPLITDSTTIGTGKVPVLEWKVGNLDTFNATKLNIPMGGNSSIKVMLIATSDIGCMDTVVRWVDVKVNPKAAFAVPYVCAGDSSKFTQNSTVDSGTISQYNWLFGDGKTSSQKTPAHKYAVYGDYNVTLVVKTNWGCTDTFASTARAFPVPKAQFSVLDICAKDSFVYTNNSKLFGDTLNAFSWNLGSLGTSVLASPRVYVQNYGTYSSWLKVTTIHGCSDTVRHSPKAFPLPVAKFGANNICLGFNTLFTDSSSVATGGISSYKWKFGDGNIDLIPSPKHNYAKAGTYNPMLWIQSDKGCTDSLLKSVIVYPLARPTFSGNSHCLGEKFVATSAVWGGGTPVSWKWYLGNGDSLLTPNINYTYTAVGIYAVKLQVMTDKGCMRDTTANIEVNQLPSVSANALNPCNDDSAVLNASATVTKGFVAGWDWYFSDGSVATGKKIAKKFNPAGPWNATFIATTDKGCKDSAKVNYQIKTPVVVDFTVGDVCRDEVSLFTDKSVSVEPITKYTWSFGDGKTSVLQNPTHIYTNDGTWNVTLKIETKPGCEYTFVKSAIVHPKPVPAFTTNPSIGTVVNPNISIADISSGADSMWYIITDGYSTLQRNFMHTFPDSGSFTIWQFTKNKYGCMDSMSSKIFINFMYTLYVPGAFTPNNDSKNEVFGPGGLGIAWYSMKIYNRWGEMVYDTEDSKPWDGTYMGEPVMAGVYSVLINIRDYKHKPHYYRGTVTVLR